MRARRETRRRTCCCRCEGEGSPDPIQGPFCKPGPPGMPCGIMAIIWGTTARTQNDGWHGCRQPSQRQQRRRSSATDGVWGFMGIGGVHERAARTSHHLRRHRSP